MAPAGVANLMSDDSSATIITMADMAAVFAVTDDFGIHRESVSVELAREDPGEISVNDRGVVEITLPASQSPPTSPLPSERAGDPWLRAQSRPGRFQCGRRWQRRGGRRRLANVGANNHSPRHLKSYRPVSRHSKASVA